MATQAVSYYFLEFGSMVAWLCPARIKPDTFSVRSFSNNTIFYYHKQLSSAVRVINHAVVVNSLEVCGFAEST